MKLLTRLEIKNCIIKGNNHLKTIDRLMTQYPDHALDPMILATQRDHHLLIYVCRKLLRCQSDRDDLVLKLLNDLWDSYPSFKNDEQYLIRSNFPMIIQACIEQLPKTRNILFYKPVVSQLKVILEQLFADTKDCHNLDSVKILIATDGILPARGHIKSAKNN